MNLDATCPCGGFGDDGRYVVCCRPFVVDGDVAPTSEQLMRSRYTAFVVRDAEHLWRTWHPSTRPSALGELGDGEWLGLEVLSTEGGQPDDTAGVVEFRARFVGPDGANALHERSRFAKRAGRWFYVDGDELP